MVGELIATNPNFTVDIEVQPQFGLSTKLATEPFDETVYRQLVDIYSFKYKLPNYCDKSHPNLWIADRLQQDFPDAKFIYCKRNPINIVKSMVKHGGVRSWYNKPMNSQLSKFLGIDKQPDELTADVLMRRVYSHYVKFTELQGKINCHIFDYDNAQDNPRKEVARLEEYLGFSFNETIIKTI